MNEEDHKEIQRLIEMKLRKKYLKKMRNIYLSFLIYLVLVLGLGISSLFTDKTWDFLQLVLYIGNVLGLGSSIYIIHSWWRTKTWWFLFLGTFLAGLNGYHLIKYLI